MLQVSKFKQISSWNLPLPPCFGGSGGTRWVRYYSVDTVWNIAITAHTHSFNFWFITREEAEAKLSDEEKKKILTLPTPHHCVTTNEPLKYRHTLDVKLRGF